MAIVRTTTAMLLALLASLPCAGAEEKTRQTVAMSQPVHAGLQAAQALIENRQYAQGHAELKKLQGMSELSNYETAQIWNLTAYAFYLQEKYPQSIGAYTRVLRQPDLPPGLVQSTLKTLSQLYFTVEKYDRALVVVDRLIKVLPEPSPDIYLLKGQAHFQLEQYRDAIAPINTAIARFREQGKPPQENWLLLLRVCYYELGEFNDMLGILRTLLRHYPRERYVLTLAGVYSELGNTGRQLALTEALYEDQRLTEPLQIVNLANLYMVHGLPYKAAKVLERETASGRVEDSERNLRLLSQAWYQAREDKKAIPPLAKAAEKSADGELYVRLAQSYINLDRWEEAATAVREGLRKGGVKRADTANLMLGMAMFNQRKLEAARHAFLAAAKDQRSAKAARQWLSYVASEQSRDSTLEQVLPEQAPAAQDAILQNL